MTVKEYAKSIGLSPQAVYKKLNRSGIELKTLKDSNTGHLTQSGIAILDGIFQPVVNQESTETQPVDNQVTELKVRLKVQEKQIEMLETQVAMLTDERDNLRKELERSQALQAAALAKIPTPAPALPAPAATQKGIIKRMVDRLRGKDRNV